LHYGNEKIPKQGVPGGQGTITITEPGEMWIEYRIARDSRMEKMMDRLSTSNGASLGGSEQRWVDAGWVSTGDGVQTSSTEFEPDGRVLLARHRVSTTVNNSASIEDPSQGFMVWLEPITVASGASARSRRAN
jgi:hypothetical protein